MNESRRICVPKITVCRLCFMAEGFQVSARRPEPFGGKYKIYGNWLKKPG